MRWLIALSLLFTVAAQATPAPGRAAVASAHPLATEAGFEILDQGGNAFDAAVAVAAALAVVEPYSAGMGGGGFWLLHRQSDGKQTMVDAREMAPGAASADMYQDRNGKVIRDKAINGPLAAGIPGQAAAFVHLARHYGKLPLRTTLAPAIRLARDGFDVEDHYRTLAGYRVDVLNRYPAAAAVFLDHGKVPAAGYRVRQPDLARTLQALAEQGRAGFYQGAVARKLVKGVRDAGGIWTEQDLDNYRVKERAPIVGHFRGGRVVSAPPPSSGGIVMMEALNILSEFNAGEISEGLLPHLTVEAMKRAYQDRARYLGDPDFVQMPVDNLLSKSYAQQRAASIDLDQATPSSELGEPVGVEEGFHTTHLSVLDADGNRVAATLSINLPFGSAFMPAGTGVILNNEMDDFSAKPGSPNAYGLVGSQANAIAPGKRPLSSMTPTFVEFKDRVAILGTPGGSRIISMVMLGVMEAAAGKPVDDWVQRVRFHHQYLPDEVEAEPAFMDSPAAKSLRLRGHKVVSVGRAYGNMQAILWHTDNGRVTAASDPRAIGAARVAVPRAANKATNDPQAVTEK
ncbi:gamma-glutamyltransferase [Alloalcanivorax mobilis]|uniref:gamma-glutamyltransferase n=1 Tax=Alloalcanivorax mobilis TaxID=2019569 RepID=UPI000C756E71|nr:gamma-glutamyltransferase [Alloalcanivorax mobilis]|tara:strand:- start:9893 stop:11605 length:1713 start_codon:yes stop_codon:yes gene_type:complete